MKKYIKVHSYNICIVFLFYLLVTANTLSFPVIQKLLGYEPLIFPSIEVGSKFEELIFVVVFAPIIETVIYNLLVFQLYKIFKNIPFLVIFSASVFAISHYYSVGYVIKSFINGLFYASCYGIFIIRLENDLYKPAVFVFVVHSAHNLTGFIIENSVY
jgi:hypothetical protein